MKQSLKREEASTRWWQESGFNNSLTFRNQFKNIPDVSYSHKLSTEKFNLGGISR
jgi:hypothetical protein